ncbi:hypothetical protein LINPERHAP2_LOCUS34119, partial [Linum perenne]
MRRCDCEVPVRQLVVHLGSRVMRIFLECPEWEYEMGCHYCEWVELVDRMKMDGGLLKSKSSYERQMMDALAQNARLQAAVAELNKRLEEIYLASQSTSNRMLDTQENRASAHPGNT